MRRVDGIPALIWGELSDKMIIAAHGSHSSKMDDCMWVLADETYILRGEMDTLSEYAYVKHFSDSFGCELTEQNGGEHWFHTEPELDFFRLWIRDRL